MYLVPVSSFNIVCQSGGFVRKVLRMANGKGSCWDGSVNVVTLFELGSFEMGLSVTFGRKQEVSIDWSTENSRIAFRKCAHTFSGWCAAGPGFIASSVGIRNRVAIENIGAFFTSGSILAS